MDFLSLFILTKLFIYKIVHLAVSLKPVYLQANYKLAAIFTSDIV